MKKEFTAVACNLLILIVIFICGLNKSFAETPTPNAPQPNKPTASANQQPALTATPPTINAQAYILIDAHTGKVLVEKNADVRRAPASLTKIMTLYVLSSGLKEGRIKLTDQVPISEKAWRTGGSKMFVKVGDYVKAMDLIQGIAVASGNDACVAMSEHMAGSEESFASVMNQQAKLLGMKDSNFTDSTGLPSEHHYSTARDLATLGSRFIRDYPEEYKWFGQQWFTFNNIKQPNRNRLLWSNLGVDGIKTGFTDDAGYCLVSSAQKDKLRLLAVILGAPSEKVRTAESQRLLTWGFRFFTSEQLYQKNKPIIQQRIWKGKTPSIGIGVAQDVYVTMPAGQHKNVKASLELPKVFEAPIKKGQVLGKLNLTNASGEVVASEPLIALEDSEQGGIYTRVKDSIGALFQRWFGGSSSEEAMKQNLD